MENTFGINLMRVLLRDYPRMQILNVEEVLAGNQVDMPPNLETYKQAEKVVAENKEDI